jgi:hypothetical protein
MTQRELVESIQNSPRVATQAQQHAAIFGPGGGGCEHHSGAGGEVVQRQSTASVIQRQESDDDDAALEDELRKEGPPIQRKAEPGLPHNRTGMPDALKAAIESLAGLDLSDVRVHTGSARPAQIDALAFAQGREIHLATGQERHLPHEAWHVVQQAQGRVPSTARTQNGERLNDDEKLEKEAEQMGAKALARAGASGVAPTALVPATSRSNDVPFSFRPAESTGGPGSQTTPSANSNGNASSAPIQRVGNPPYKKEISLQTPYVVLRIKHPTSDNIAASGAAADPAADLQTKVNQYQVIQFDAKGKQRPPAYIGGQASPVQGQHKVAWTAIWNALGRCIGQTLPAAKATMTDIFAKSGLSEANPENPVITTTMQLSSPLAADALIKQGHDYLVKRQKDNPSWAATGSADEKKSQLDGKGEKGLIDTMYAWQNTSAVDPNVTDAVVKEFFTDSFIKLLFDVTGRSGAELTDVLARAKRELRIHNSALAQKYDALIDQWFVFKRTGAWPAAANVGAAAAVPAGGATAAVNYGSHAKFKAKK